MSGKRFFHQEQAPGVHQMRDGAFYGKRVEDAPPLRWCDAILNGEFRITPQTRITAERAPGVEPGSMGVRLVGHQGPAPTQIDLDASVGELAGRGLLTAAEAARVRAALKRASGKEQGPTNAAGITANDALAESRMSIQRGEEMAKAHRALWDNVPQFG